MKIKLILLIAAITIAIVTTVVVIFEVTSRPRQYDDVLAEIVVWPGGRWSRGSLINYFVVTNDGILISYYGRSRRDGDSTMTYNFIRSVREREEVILSEEDFLYIYELVNSIVVDTSERLIWASSLVMFLHNGNIYEHSSAWSNPLRDLIRAISRLSPLPVRA